ncbi:MAG: 4Fe-4S dicluster domain-containing protein [Pelolinea sp.]|nr:4Fe-4S dicluster domain-containing protein [Pelolinea sp.]
MASIMDDFSQVRKEAARILSEKIVDMVIGFKQGTIPLKSQPMFITSQEDTDKLILDGFCQNNLAVFLHDQPKDKRIGIICRACESRAVRALVIEHQVNRENLYLIGVPCMGILDWKKIQDAADGPVTNAQESGDQILLEIGDKKQVLIRNEFIVDSCRGCGHREPIDVDIQIGEISPIEMNADNLPQTWGESFKSKSADERFQLFTEETERCIRCYACREACPMCYCTECFVDHIAPRWSESMVTPGGTQAWHIIRAFHQTGRCVECGACERACPMDIKMVYLTDKLNDDMKKEYGFEVGENEEKQPPFATITLDDKNRFKY